MEFGSKEWFERVEKLYAFPAVFGFYTTNKSRVINSAVIETKASKVEEIKYQKISPNFTLNSGEKLALLEVKKLYSPQEYYDTVCQLKEDWA